MNGDDISERSNRHKIDAEREDLRRAARIGPTPMSDTRAAIDAERARRHATGAAFVETWNTMRVLAGDKVAPIGESLISALRAKGYDVVKIEGDR
jgi:hypothetical protein